MAGINPMIDRSSAERSDMANDLTWMARGDAESARRQARLGALNEGHRGPDRGGLSATAAACGTSIGAFKVKQVTTER